MIGYINPGTCWGFQSSFALLQVRYPCTVLFMDGKVNMILVWLSSHRWLRINALHTDLVNSNAINPRKSPKLQRSYSQWQTLHNRIIRTTHCASCKSISSSLSATYWFVKLYKDRRFLQHVALLAMQSAIALKIAKLPHQLPLSTCLSHNRFVARQ